MFHQKVMDEGLGQLEAYAGKEEGVAFKMDNGMFWCSVENHKFGIQAVNQKKSSCKFFVVITEPGKVFLSNCKGRLLAPKLLTESCPILAESRPIYPLQPTYRKLLVSSEFKVFHKGNKVAFQTHDGCFLTKSFRGVYIVEASKTSVDSSCFFQPEIGTLLGPNYTIADVVLGDLSKVRCRPCVLKKDTLVNQTDEPLIHTFVWSWVEEGVQTTAWQHRWGLGLTAIADFTIKGMEAVIKYNQDNDQVVFVPQPIFETFVEEVVLPPRTKATARLLVHKQNNVTVPFLAKIRKLRRGGTVESLFEPGVWKGLVYHGLKLEVKVEPLGTPCAIM